VLVLLLAIATLGVAYGLWSKTLTITGVVHTGEVDARWLGGVCNEFHTWPNLPQLPGDYGEAEGKDVGSFELSVNPDDDQLLDFQLTNVYPSYAIDCQVHFMVEGSIPVYLRGTDIIPGLNLTGCTVTGNQTRVMSCDQLTVRLVDGIGAQLHPGEEDASSLTVHVEQAAGQDTSYQFSVVFCMAQWNEHPTPGQCFAASLP
jgi:hypothetical protein